MTAPATAADAGADSAPGTPACAAARLGEIGPGGGRPGVAVLHTVGAAAGGDAIVFESKLSIDADGGRHAYRDDDKGLDTIKNACSPGNPCYGIVELPDGTRVRQKPPRQAYFVTPTSLRDRTRPTTDQDAYVDSESIAYIALPGKTLAKLAKAAAVSPFPLRLGDVAFVRNRKNGKTVFAIFADQGPGGKIGEGSIALANALGIPSNPRRGGASGGVQVAVFLGSGTGKPLSQDEIDRQARSHLQTWGGEARVKACLETGGN